MRTATVTIDAISWNVDVQDSVAEKMQGFSSIASTPVNTGKLFNLRSESASIGINMSDMLFNLDIIFLDIPINATVGTVAGVLRNVPPGANVYFTAGPANYFMEVNAHEADTLQAGDSIHVTNIVGSDVGDYPSTSTSASGFDINSILPLIMVMMMMGMFSTISRAMDNPAGKTAKVVNKAASAMDKGTSYVANKFNQGTSKVANSFFGKKV
jgi:uncharacterized membrane protein (UPF0127 family)